MTVPEARLIDAFLQVSLHQGFGVLDNRGKLIVAFGDPFKTVEQVIENGLETIRLFGPVESTQPVVEIKFSAAMIWLHFQAGASRAAIRQEGTRIVREACDLIGVSQFSRQGLRAQSIFATGDRERAVHMLLNGVVPSREWQSIGVVLSASATVTVGAPPLSANVTVLPVERTKVTTVVQVAGSPIPAVEDQSPPEFGVMLDADIYDDRLSDAADPKPHLNRAIGFLDDRLIPLVAKLLGESADHEPNLR